MSDAGFPDWLVLAAVPGHVSWLLWLDNRIHATAWDYHAIKLLGTTFKAAIILGSLLAAAWWLAETIAPAATPDLPFVVTAYVVASAVNTIVGFFPWLVRRLTFRNADVLLSDKARLVDLRPTLGNPPEIRHRQTRWAVNLPGNQYLSVALHEKRLRIPRLPAQLDGLRVVHLTDLHLTGRLGKPFYQRIAELANEAEPDLIALTGDLVEHEACWDWIPDVFGRLRARYGAYFVLGNHDVRIDHRETRRRLKDVGLVDVGGALHTIDVRGVPMLIVGSARPWVDEIVEPPPISDDARPFRLFLSHSPDEYPWGRRHDFDLMLAGHVHGGQIQFPPVGPILAPSRFGVRYACGVFHEPPTVLHVSRGTSSKAPLRFHCPPELTTLILSGPG